MEAFSFSAPRFTDEDELREQAEMSEKEREEVENDLFGRYFLKEETPEFRDRCLAKMEAVVETKYSEEEKDAYLQACRECPELVRTEAAPIRFLRSENYDPERAAQRLVNYWEMRRAMFKEKAFLPLKLDGGALTEEDKRALRWGHTVILPDDKHGRLVLCHDRSCFDLKEMNHPSVIRSMWYVVHAAMEHEEYCRTGLVVMIPSHNTTPHHFSRKHIKLLWKSIRECLPIRARAIHACHPTVVTDLVLPVIRQVMGRPLRRRWIRHVGSKEEVLRKLEQYGLEREHLPAVLGGTWVKNASWIEERRQLEHDRDALESRPEVDDDGQF